MRSVFSRAAFMGIAVFCASVPLLAQLQDNTEKQLTCGNRDQDNDRPRHCEIREQSFASIGRLNIDSVRNGGVTVKGSLRGDVLVRSRIEASGETEGAASIMTSRVLIDGSGGQVRATGPETTNDDSWWSVTYEIFVPQATDLTLKTTNGGINISDVRGTLSFEGVNGGVRLKRVVGEIKGRTVNGGIDVELAGFASDARQIELSTVNGGVTVAMPANYSASVQTETGQGRVQSDFPLPAQTGASRPRRMDFLIGSGGPQMHITTGNGGIRLKRAETR